MVCISTKVCFNIVIPFQDRTTRKTAATLAEFGVQPGCSIQVHVQLVELPAGLRSANFFLHWGYPHRNRRRDFLDTTVFFFSRRKEVAVTDFRGHHTDEDVYMDDSVTHSAGIMNNKTRSGKNLVTIDFDNVPQRVNTIFFTLTSCRAPRIDLFPNMYMSFYDPDTEEELCENYVMDPPHSKGIIVCKVVRTGAAGWEVISIGLPTAGNVYNYKPIRQALQKLVR